MTVEQTTMIPEATVDPRFSSADAIPMRRWPSGAFAFQRARSYASIFPAVTPCCVSRPNLRRAIKTGCCPSPPSSPNS